MAIQTTVLQQSLRPSAIRVLMQNLAALALGVIILYLVGFAPMDIVHNAAHDTRHTITFPCH